MVLLLEMKKNIIQKHIIPQQSVLKAEEQSYGYIDCFQGSFSGEKLQNDIIPVVGIFTSSGPKWAITLMKIRDRIVKSFGLKISGQTTDEQEQPDSIRYAPGSQHGIFKLLSKSQNEVILGEDDKHLDFKVSLLVEPSVDNSYNQLSITTVVKFNNLFGKLYFLPVKPFHKLIVRKLLENVILRLEKE